MSRHTKTSDISLLTLPTFERGGGILTFLETEQSLFKSFKRVFFISAYSGTMRGSHAHRECKQWIFCTSGAISISLKDGTSVEKFVLSSINSAVYVPAGIWVEIDFIEDSVMTVLADMTYNELDYIRDWQEFLEYKGVK